MFRSGVIFSLFIFFVFIFLNNVSYATNNMEPKNIQVDSVLLMEPATGRILYSLNPTLKITPASLVKIMTLLVVFDYVNDNKLDISQKITIPLPDKKIAGKTINLRPGEKITIEDLIKACAIYSANDAAYELARFVAGTEDKFVDLMNKKADSIGLKNTKFYNSHGIPYPGKGDQYSCAIDIAKLTGYFCARHPEILQYTSRKKDTIRNGATVIENTNKLLSMRSDITGFKTGYVRSSGYCVVATALNRNVPIICVIIGAKDENIRFIIADELLKYGYDKSGIQ